MLLLDKLIVRRTLNVSLFVLSLVATAPLTAQDSFDLEVEFVKSSQFRVDSTIEHDGYVLLQSDEDNRIKPLSLNVKGALGYFQRTTGASQAIRYFDKAQAKIDLEKGQTTPQLAESNRLIVARSKPKAVGRVEMASIQATLTQPELELIQSPADPLCIAELFSKDDVEVGASWKPGYQALARFLSVDSIESSSVNLKVKKVDKGVARIYIGGKVIANAFDVTSSINLYGLALINLKAKQIQSLKLTLQMDRPAGQIEPGYKGTSKFASTFDYGQETDWLSNRKLAKLAKSRKIQQRLQHTSVAGAFQIVFEPRWKLIASETDSAIMRFIDKGNLITQCNVVMLPTRPADQPLSLKKFESEITKAIDADKNAQVVTSNQRQTTNGLAALSVVIEGEEDGLPVNWFYYHVSGKDGRQMTFVFTLAKSVAVQAKGVADQLVNEFRFTQKASKKSTAQADKKNTKR